MNPLTDFIFTVTWFALFVFAIRSIIKGWSIMRNAPSQGYVVEKKTVTKIPHPEITERTAHTKRKTHVKEKTMSVTGFID